MDHGVSGRLNLDYATTAPSGIEYGAHAELDLFQSDGDLISVASRNVAAAGPILRADAVIGDFIDFEDGYVFIKSSLGKVALGDTGLAGKASNQLHVPILAIGAMEYDNLQFFGEGEQAFYSNTWAGIEFEVSTNDDLDWSLGLGYAANVGQALVELGVSAGRSRGVIGLADTDHLAGSLELQIGGLTAGANYASAVTKQFQTSEYIAAGLAYDFGALSIGAGVETHIWHWSSWGSDELYVSNLFAGLDYELADGLILAFGIGNLDADSWGNGANRGLVFALAPARERQRTTNAVASVKVEF